MVCQSKERKKQWIDHFAAKGLTAQEGVKQETQYPVRTFGFSNSLAHFMATLLSVFQQV